MRYSILLVGFPLLLTGPAAESQSPSAPQIAQRLKERGARAALRIDVLEVDFSQHGQPLWQGSVRVNRMNRAILSIEGEEAAGTKCRPLGFHSNTYRLTIDVMKWGGGIADPDQYSVDATINRTDLSADCTAKIASGSRITKQVVRIRRGQTIELDSSDGFHIAIHRPG